MRDKPIYRVKTVTIAANESLSSVIDMDGYQNVAVIMPAGWDTADMTFAASTEIDGTFIPIHDTSGEVTITNPAASTAFVLSEQLRPFKFIKIRSGTSANAVAQSADRVLIVVQS